MQAMVLHSDVAEFMSFRLSDRRYAVDINRVREIQMDREITRIPNAPDYIEGAINLRGKVIPVLNLRRRFGMEGRPPEATSRIIIMTVRGLLMGFLIDAVSDVLRVPVDEIVPPPPVRSMKYSGLVQGIAKLKDSLVVLLDMDSLLTEEEFRSVFDVGDSIIDKA